MKVRHVFGDQVYHISNYAVAGEFLFLSREDKERFVEGMKIYLGEILEVLEYVLFDDQYRIIVKLKDKWIINDFYRKKKKDQETDEGFIPAETYVFSQQMANFQISYAKYFNYKYRRKGSVFRQRFDRYLIESAEELKGYLKGMRLLERYNEQSYMWQKVRNDEEVILGSEVDCTGDGSGNGENFIASFHISDLRSQIPNFLKRDLISPFLIKIIDHYRKKPKIGPIWC